jgi:glycosyltransferase involved in cell wall biosynthesis
MIICCSGRIYPIALEAVELARRTGRRLILAGIIHDRPYFENQVAPYLDGEQIQYIGPVRAEERNSVLGGAMAMLHLINFNEPFGLSMVEAMACDTGHCLRRIRARK